MAPDHFGLLSQIAIGLMLIWVAVVQFAFWMAAIFAALVFCFHKEPRNGSRSRV